MKLLLHIGTDKTGSTAIQKHLYANRRWFLKHGVYIPVTGLGKDNGHGELLETMSPEAMSHVQAELLQARQDGYTRAVLSWEGMSFMKPTQILQLGLSLNSLNLWLLIYLREQADITQTSYLQEVKTGASPFSIDDFQGVPRSTSALRALLFCYSPRRNYARLLRKWMRIIPQGNAIVREYRRDVLIDGSIIDDFLSQIGVHADRDFLRREQEANISLDVESAIIMNERDNASSTSLPRKADSFTLLSIIDSTGFGSRYFLSPSRVASIRRYYKRTNRLVGDVIGSPIPDLFANPRPCARDYTEKQIKNRTDFKRQRLASLQAVPMLFTTRIPHDSPSKNILSAGWSTMQEWGAWSEGADSEIRFRAPFWMISHEKAHVIIFLKGRYQGRNTRSEISVNGLNYGWLDLRRFVRTITLPVSAMQRNQTVVVKIAHEFAEEQSSPPNTTMSPPTAFGIEKFGIQFSNPE
ncbi:MAG: hypothetical protein HRT77_05990 [Halioglobus sp.]|nr:hypothetical protein [Halioglobus sp.]